MELKVDRLTKQYKNKIAVDRISFSLQKGVTGLLGANGAGKTTLMRMICGILTPTGGDISYDGIDVSDEKFRNILGYLPQDFGYYPEFTGADFLMYFSPCFWSSEICSDKMAFNSLTVSFFLSSSGVNNLSG